MIWNTDKNQRMATSKEAEYFTVKQLSDEHSPSETTETTETLMLLSKGYETLNKHWLNLKTKQAKAGQMMPYFCFTEGLPAFKSVPSTGCGVQYLNTKITWDGTSRISGLFCWNSLCLIAAGVLLILQTNGVSGRNQTGNTGVTGEHEMLELIR